MLSKMFSLLVVVLFVSVTGFSEHTGPQGPGNRPPFGNNEGCEGEFSLMANQSPGKLTIRKAPGGFQGSIDYGGGFRPELTNIRCRGNQISFEYTNPQGQLFAFKGTVSRCAGKGAAMLEGTFDYYVNNSVSNGQFCATK